MTSDPVQLDGGNVVLLHGDSLDLMRSMPDDSADLVFTSPPYEAARTYGIEFDLTGEQYVAWAVERYVECYRVCRGLVAWVIEGQTRKFQYSAAPILMAADLHRRGVRLRKPPVFYRVGIPGSGGPDWLRNDYEFIVCATKGKLPWSDNTAMGHPPKWAPGGEMSNRLSDGARVNQWGHCGSGKGMGARKADGTFADYNRPSHKQIVMTRNQPGLHAQVPSAVMPVKANPGNVIKCNVGGGVMGNRLCHENEAPFPESLARFFIRSFCPPDGTVLDPFCGSGTTAAVASLEGRKAIGIDIRDTQVVLSRRRIEAELALRDGRCPLFPMTPPTQGATI